MKKIYRGQELFKRSNKKDGLFAYGLIIINVILFRDIGFFTAYEFYFSNTFLSPTTL